MAERNDRLRARREAVESPDVPGACMSRAELAEAANAWVATNTDRHGALDENYVARLEQGRVRWPGREYRAALRAILHATSDDELGFRPSNRRPVSPLTMVIADSEGLLTQEDKERLELVTACPRRTDRAALDSLAEVLLTTRKLEDETSAAHVIGIVRAQQAVVDRLAAGARSSLRVKAVGLSSEINQYLGWLNIPLRKWDVSRTWLDRAAVSAMEADDPDRLSTALSFDAYRSLLLNDYRSANALNEAARRDTRVDIRQRTYETYQQAEVLARDGNRTEAVKLLAEADTMVSRLPSDDEVPDWGYWYIPAFFVGQRGVVLQALGDSQSARDAARESLAAMPQAWVDSEWAVERRRLAEG